MKLALSGALLVSALLCLSACNKAESPDKVQEDVAKAQAKAADENAKADEKVKQVEAEAVKDRQGGRQECRRHSGLRGY
jgi:hypothetical protein